MGKCFLSGDNRTNVQPGLTIYHTLWHRWGEGEEEEEEEEEEDEEADEEAEAGYDTDSSVTIHGASVVTEL